MVNNKILILRESELIDFISYVVTDVIKEQEVIDGQIYIQDPGQGGSTPSVDYQVKKSGHELANSSPEQFVEYWHNRCMRLTGPVRDMQSTSGYAEKCFSSMPQTSKNYMTGHNNNNRRTILLLWKEKTNKILARIDDELVPRMTHAYDVENLTAANIELYNKYENWVASRFYKEYPELNPNKGGSWKTLEYIADAIGIIGLFFGPVGWVVSGVAGLVSAYAMWQQGNKGGAYVVGALEFIPGLKLFKHIKHVKMFKKMDPNQIAKSLGFFEEPTELAYKRLNLVEKELVDYVVKNPHIVKPLLKVTKEAKDASKVILEIKNMKEFWKFAKTKEGIKHGLDKIGWKEFQQIQKALTQSQKIIKNVKKGVVVAAPFVVGIVPALYAVQWAMYGANKQIFENIFNDTDDLITSAKLDNIYHYRYDRVINQTYPYNRGFNRDWSDGKYGRDEDYTDAFKGMVAGSPPNILLLIKLWGDEKMFPEITPSGNCVGVDLGEVANPGGGWRPNLNCLKDYNLNRRLGQIQEEGEKLISDVTAILEAVKEGEMTETEAKRESGILLNLGPVEYEKIDFSDIDTTEYKIY